MTIRNDTGIARRIRHARLATILGFMMIGGMMYIWSTGVSALRHQLGLAGSAGDLNYGMLAFGIGAGAAAGALFTGRLLDRFGARKVVRVAVILYPLSIIPLGFASEFCFALSVGVLLGVFRGATETALNAHGVQVERFYGRPIMSNFHACFSLGGFLFGMLGSYFAGLQPQSALYPFAITGTLLLLLSLAFSGFMLEKDEVLAQTQSGHATALPAERGEGRPFLLMLGFGLLLLAVMVGEGAVGDWGQEFIHRELGATTAFAGLAISCFTGAEFIGRLIGDRLTQRFGAARVVMASGAVSLAGLVLAQLGDARLALIGFALFGLGMSCLAPLLLSSAGRKDPRNAGRNIGIVNCVGFSGMLVGPAGISLAVDHYGLDVLLFFPMALMLLMTLVGPRLVGSRTPPAAGPVPRGSTRLTGANSI
ncbi:MULTISPECIES: MFS transporter [Pseudomonas]|uniref:MFS transporter n=1 Tax=Pseudomonas TaxID=286 RepID=UPI0002A1A21A|nr:MULTISPECIES: MFS transporter [Pseudomonas]MBB1606997.1 MFS transporter [Pseudomonas sp. UMC76]MBB1637891.1 MFS transporter [Pseudomonas sp. UME83]NTX88625.1 MFS transporter [Pseudomonas sp. UMA643]NTY18907.1 MFS transporter [Pseudomonas sp. UMC3103]NTY25908.1 MFS transporter [Pseudomonas sp. UMA603]